MRTGLLGNDTKDNNSTIYGSNKTRNNKNQNTNPN
jgi:hypothetical protein